MNDISPVHNWFGLSYASYFVMPRSVLQSMPFEWQWEFIALINEIPSQLQVDDMPSYRVNMVDDKNKFVKDPFADYERGRRKIAKK